MNVRRIEKWIGSMEKRDRIDFIYDGDARCRHLIWIQPPELIMTVYDDVTAQKKKMQFTRPIPREKVEARPIGTATVTRDARSPRHHSSPKVTFNIFSFSFFFLLRLFLFIASFLFLKVYHMNGFHLDASVRTVRPPVIFFLFFVYEAVDFIEDFFYMSFKCQLISIFVILPYISSLIFPSFYFFLFLFDSL